jgi:hypothetical protein
VALYVRSEDITLYTETSNRTVPNVRRVSRSLPHSRVTLQAECSQLIALLDKI